MSTEPTKILKVKLLAGDLRTAQSVNVVGIRLEGVRFLVLSLGFRKFQKKCQQSRAVGLEAFAPGYRTRVLTSSYGDHLF